LPSFSLNSDIITCLIIRHLMFCLMI
jgi:hypothetical protein